MKKKVCIIVAVVFVGFAAALLGILLYARPSGGFDPQLPEGVEAGHDIDEYTNLLGLFDMERFFSEHGWDVGYRSSKDFYRSWQDKVDGPLYYASQVGVCCYEDSGGIKLCGFDILYVGDCERVYVYYDPGMGYRTITTTSFGKVPRIVIEMLDAAFDTIQKEPYSLDEKFEALNGKIPGISIVVERGDVRKELEQY